MTAVQVRPQDQQFDALTERLCGEYPDEGDGTVAALVREVRAEFAHATVSTYLPVLVERGVRSRLGPPARRAGP